MSDLAFERSARGSIEATIDRLTTELATRGFGVLGTMRLHAILREKLGEEIEPLVLLDVCAPKFAHRALAISREAALLLPCKIAVSRETGGTRVSLQRPTTLIRSLLPRPELLALAEEVERSLGEAIERAVASPAPAEGSTAERASRS